MRDLLLRGSMANSISSSKRNFYMVSAEWETESCVILRKWAVNSPKESVYGFRVGLKEHDFLYSRAIVALCRNCFMTSCRCWTMNNYSLLWAVWVGKSCYRLLEFHSLVSLKFCWSYCWQHVTLSWQLLIYAVYQATAGPIWACYHGNQTPGRLHQGIISKSLIFLKTVCFNLIVSITLFFCAFWKV